MTEIPLIAGKGPELMPTLFGPEDSQYDRYAACLAATEGLRKMKEKAVGRKPKFGKKETETEDEKRANAEYVLNSSKIVEALGMSVSQFNQLGRQVNQDPNLKYKVSIHQYVEAYFALVRII